MAIKGFKGFDKNLKCRDFQYQIGGEYEEKRAVICDSGFHFCENPLDVFTYYPPASSRYTEVDGDGETNRQENGDSKVSCAKIKIGTEIKLSGMIHAAVQFIMGKASGNIATGDWGHAAATGNEGHAAATGYEGHAAATGNRGHAAATGNEGHAAATGYEGHAAATGNRGHAAATGNRGHAAATGDGGHAAATGDWGHAAATGYEGHAAATGNRGHAAATGNEGHAAVSGKDAVAMAVGIESKAKGALGCWIVLAEWEEGTDRYYIAEVKSAKVDGEKIKADTFYQLKDGVFVEAE